MKDGVIFIIDTGPMSLSKNFSCKLKKIFEILRERISYTCLSNGNLEEVCVILINTLNSSKCYEEISSSYTFISMDVINVDMVKKFDTLLKKHDFVDSILQITGGFGNVSLVDLFHKCNKLLNFCKSLKKKSIIFITPNYNHFENLDTESSPILKMAINDLKKNDASINVIIVDENTNNDNLSWNKLGVNVEFCDNLDNLLLILNMKCTRTKCHRNISLYLTENFNIKVDLYNVVDLKENPKGFHIDAVTNKVIKCNQTYKINNDDEVFNTYEDIYDDEMYINSNMILRLDFYGKKLDFTQSEVLGMREILSSGIQILGFRKMEEFNLDYIYSIPIFVSAIEKNFKDKRIFFSLYNSCVNKNVFIVGRYALRANFAPQLAALIPTSNSKEGFFKHKGFYLIKMPFKENIRIVSGINTTVETSLCDETKQFIKENTSNFTPLKYENPMLGKHYRGIEALALDKKITEINEPLHYLS